MARQYGGITCDSCDVPNDGDIFAQNIGETFPGIRPKNQRELAFFWLCGECKPEYPRGARSFYIEEFFDTEPYCDDCEVEEVSAWGKVCGWCDGSEEEL